jgi:signal transduction histidine kinase
MIDAASLDSVVATDELASRPARAPDHAAESAALMQLIDEMRHPSRHVLQRLVEIACDLCHAGSAGVSILESEHGKARFRWHALTGALHEHLWGITPRDFSPCGVVIDRNAVQLFRYPERHFRYFAEVRPQIVEGLLVPFLVNRQPVGTIWVVTHDTVRHFDREDARLITNLGRVASAAHDLHGVLEDLRATNRRKDEFLGLLSHEMRNPLAAMTNSIRYLHHVGGGDADQERARAVLQRQLQQITRLSEDLLDVARLGKGELELRPEPTDLLQAVRAGREAALPALAEYDREIVIELPDAPMMILADPARLTQVITNLLTNTARRTRSGGRATLAVRGDGPDAVITVASETEAVAAGWTDPPRAVGLSAPGASGAAQGLGLTLARSLTEMLGGRVTTVDVGSARNNGFELRFPLLEAPSVAVTRRATSAPPRERLRRERVLIVDDCVDSADSLAMLLQSWGHEVRTAQGANAGLRVEWDFEPQAVILDIEMPGKSGYEVAAELRVRRRRELLLVALSGHAREEDRTRSLAAGFDHHMTKPANVEMLRRLLG